MEETRFLLLKIVLSAVISCMFFTPASSKLSDYITICSAKDPALEKCLISSGQKLFKAMEMGIPEYDIKPVDPMSVPRLGIQRGDTGMALVLINSTHRGLAQTVIKSAKVDPKKQTFEFGINIPSYTISGQYDVNGKAMLLPIKGHGNSNITLYDIEGVWSLKGGLVKRDGKEFMELREFTATVNPKNMKVRFENLFNGNQLLGETMNNLLNEHWKDVFRQIKPTLEKSYGELLSAFGSKIFSKTPYNEIFSDL